MSRPAGRPRRVITSRILPMDTCTELPLCIICQDAPRDVRFHDCGHSHACVLCTLKLISRAGRELTCPTCKEAVVLIESWDSLACAPQPEFVRDRRSGVDVEKFIDQHSTSNNKVAAAAKKAWARAPARHVMERVHEVQTRELTGCWLNICTMAPVLPCRLYDVRMERDDILSFRALVCCAGVCMFPSSGKYRRDNHYDELRYERVDEGLSASTFFVTSRRRMATDVGGSVFKIW